MNKLLALIVGLFFTCTAVISQETDAKSIVDKSNNLMLGKSSFSKMTMAIIRPEWTRTVSMQSWIGSDFTNDDLVRANSIINDYTHKLIGEEMIEEHDCYIIELIPLPEAPVVWGKIKMWVSKTEYYQLTS